MIILKILGIAAIVVAALFVLTFVVYFFNLDMKLTAALEPIFLKHYDKIKRDRHLYYEALRRNHRRLVRPAEGFPHSVPTPVGPLAGHRGAEYDPALGYGL